MGFDFRATLSYVTDPAYGVFVPAITYPHTFTNSNGDSINAGWDVGPGAQDLASTNDPRIAGDNYHVNDGTTTFFKVDLASGSAPGAGDYIIDLAMGDANTSRIATFKVLDDTTVLIDGTNGGSGFSTSPGHYIDATLTDVAATTTWTGTTVTKTFATTTAQLAMVYFSLSDYTLVAHFRLTLASALSNTTITPKSAICQGTYS